MYIYIYDILYIIYIWYFKRNNVRFTTIISTKLYMDNFLLILRTINRKSYRKEHFNHYWMIKICQLRIFWPLFFFFSMMYIYIYIYIYISINSVEIDIFFLYLEIITNEQKKCKITYLSSYTQYRYCDADKPTNNI